MSFIGLPFLAWMVIICYFLVVFGLAAYYTKKAGSSTSEYFLSGRNMPWWLAGTAMVATTFAADTPLAVTELVAKNGIAGNWLWWNLAIGSMLTVFFFAKLWRRSGIVTDVEFVELRYSGKPAAVLRGFRAIYLGLFMNAIVIAWVSKAMEKILQVNIPGFDAFTLVVICCIIVSIYASASGLLGLARIDALQFLIAMTGCIILAVVVVADPKVGGITGMQSQLTGKIGNWVLEFTPNVGGSVADAALGGTLAISFGAFIAYVGIQWWSCWYPGADPGGGGYIAQRMMSAKNEKHSLFATLWFTVAHYCLRPWPWILVALGGLLILPRFSQYQMKHTDIVSKYEKAFPIVKEEKLSGKNDIYVKDPQLAEKVREFKAESLKDKDFYERYENTVDPGKMFPKLMKRLSPGLLGIMLAVFLSAFMSTTSSQLNWGTSYLINDFYRRFIKKNGSEKHYVLVSRITVVLLMVFALLITKYVLTTISGAWEFIINASAGIGAVLILRWFWWRINAWSEISAMIAPLIIYPVSKYVFHMQSPITLYPTVIGTTIVWLAVTFMTAPAKEETLAKFYKKIHPGGIGWSGFRKKYPEVVSDSGYGRLFVNWFLGVLLVYSCLFATGRIIFHDYPKGFLFLAVGIISGIGIYFNIRKDLEAGKNG